MNGAMRRGQAMRFVFTDGNNADFVALCHGLDDFLNEIAGGEENRAEYILHNSLEGIHDVVIAYDGDVPVGCVSFKRYNEECAEVKRVFVRPEYRGVGVSKTLMKLLEDAARESRVTALSFWNPAIRSLQRWRYIDPWGIGLSQTTSRTKTSQTRFA